MLKTSTHPWQLYTANCLQDLASFSLVDRYFTAFATPFLYRNVLDFSASRAVQSMNLLRRLVSTKEHACSPHLRYVQNLTVSVPRNEDAVTVRSFHLDKAISHIVANAANLKTFR